MASFNHQVDGSVALVLGEIIVGIVVLFIGVFMLASIEPVFGDLNTCTYANDLGTPQLLLNASVGLQQSRNMSFTPTAVARGTCEIYLLVTNNTNVGTGTYLECRNGKTPALLLANITVPATNLWIPIPAINGAIVVNMTAHGTNNVTVNSTSYIRCCNSLIRSAGPAGRYFDQVTATAAVAFSVFGLVLIIIGLVTAICSLKNMF